MNSAIHHCLKQFFKNKAVKYTAFIFMVAGILFLAIWTMAFIRSMRNFDLGEYYFHKQEYIKAITFFDRSLHWYTPFNPYVERSTKYLWGISEQAEQINDVKLSLIALEAIKNSFYSSRSIYSPGINWINRCEKKIANILNNHKEMISPQSEGDGVEGTIHISSLEYNDPNLFWTIILEIGLLDWIGSVICLIFLGLGVENKSTGFFRSCWFWMMLIGINYSFWIIGIIKA